MRSQSKVILTLIRSRSPALREQQAVPWFASSAARTPWLRDLQPADQGGIAMQVGGKRAPESFHANGLDLGCAPRVRKLSASCRIRLWATPSGGAQQAGRMHKSLRNAEPRAFS